MENLLIRLTDLSTGNAYWVIFGLLVACGLGFPLPEDIPLIATGLMISYETMSWIPAITITILGVIIGDTILFFLGKKMGLKILENSRVQTLFRPEKVRRTRAYFRKYGEKIVFFARFVAGFRAVAFFMAGAMKMKYHRFIILDGLAALLSVPLWIVLGYGLGYYFGDEFNEIFKNLKEVKNIFTVVIAVIASVVLIRSYRKYQKARKKGLKRKTSLKKA